MGGRGVFHTARTPPHFATFREGDVVEVVTQIVMISYVFLVGEGL